MAVVCRTTMLEAGQKAPRSKLEYKDGTEVSLEDILSDGSGLVLFSIPKTAPGVVPRKHVTSEMHSKYFVLVIQG